MKKSLEDYEVESLVDMTEPEVEGMVRLKAARAALAARDER